ncbi:hypothetical protein, partial [Belliella aquatica]
TGKNTGLNKNPSHTRWGWSDGYSDLLHTLHEIFTNFILNINSRISIEIEPEKIASKKKEYEELKNSKQAEIENKLDELFNILNDTSIELAFAEEIKNDLLKKIFKIQSTFKNESYQIKYSVVKDTEKNISKELNSLIASIKTTFESNSNKALYEFVYRLKTLTKSKFKEFNDQNQFIELLHFELDLKVSSLNTKELIDKHIVSEKILVKDNTVWYNPFSWNGRLNEYKTEDYVSSDVFLKHIIDPERKRLTSALKSSENTLIEKSKIILQEFLNIIFNHAEETINEINTQYINSLKESESDFRLKEERLNNLRVLLQKKYKNIVA